jgi:hypothetical protein
LLVDDIDNYDRGNVGKQCKPSCIQRESVNNSCETSWLCMTGWGPCPEPYRSHLRRVPNRDVIALHSPGTCP